MSRTTFPPSSAKTLNSAAGAFSGVEHWVFDLDNTLYPPACDLFGQIDQRMCAFIMNFLNVDDNEARRLQKAFYVQHGTTLSGLMAEHGVEPEAFLSYVHEIDVSVVEPHEKLGYAIRSLPGTKTVFTNGSVRHATNVIQRLGIADVFSGIYDIASTGYAPKPGRMAYERFVSTSGIDPARAAMFEDIPRNLAVPHELGMVTVWVKPQAIERTMPAERHLRLSLEEGDAPYVHHATEDLAAFLESLTGSAASE